MKMAGIAAGCLLFFVALGGCGSKKCEITYERRPAGAPAAGYAGGAARRQDGSGQGERHGVAAIPVPAVEVDEELVPVVEEDEELVLVLEEDEEIVEFVEKKDVKLADAPVMIDFPEEADSPDQFGLEAETRTGEAVKAANEAAREAVEEVAKQSEMPLRPPEKAPPAPIAPAAAPVPVDEGALEERAVLPVVPEVFPAAHYTFPPEEAARVLDEMFRDPFTPDKYALVKVESEEAGQAEELFDLATGPLLAEPEAGVPEVAFVREEALAEPIAEPVAVAVAEIVPEAVPESMRPPVEMAALPASLALPALPPPSEEFVPMSIGLALDEKEFPLAKPAALASAPAKEEYGLDEDREFVPMPVKGEIVEEEDELEFFGRMSNTLGLEMVE